jgi:hypothetical protein
MNTAPDETNLWEPLSAGELGRIAVRRRRRRRTLAVGQLTTAVALLLVAGGLYLHFGSEPEPPRRQAKPGEFDYGGITCTEMHEVEAGLKAGTLDAKTMARVRAHLELCPHCKGFRKFLRDPVQTGWRSCADPDCPVHGREATLRKYQAHDRRSAVSRAGPEVLGGFGETALPHHGCDIVGVFAYRFMLRTSRAPAPGAS